MAYYRARSPEYFEGAIEMSPETESAVRAELLAAFDEFRATGDVLELACGPGTWTAELLRYADTVTALDASPEMLARAREAVPDERVTFGQADLFSWRPARRYDAVFFGFWISHVPLERLEGFFATVADALLPGGRVMFMDDAYRTGDELIEGPDSSTIERRLRDGTSYRIVKVPHTPEALQRRLAAFGWRFTVRPTSGPFYYGIGELCLPGTNS